MTYTTCHNQPWTMKQTKGKKKLGILLRNTPYLFFLARVEVEPDTIQKIVKKERKCGDCKRAPWSISIYIVTNYYVRYVHDTTNIRGPANS